jgi:hypothetical protein
MASTSLAPSPSQANEIRSESAALIPATVSSLTGIWQASSALAMTQAAEPYLISLGSAPSHSKLSRQPLRHRPPQWHLMPQRGGGSCLAGHRQQEGLAQLLATNTLGQERVTDVVGRENRFLVWIPGRPAPHAWHRDYRLGALTG